MQILNPMRDIMGNLQPFLPAQTPFIVA